MTERIELDVIDPSINCDDCGLCCQHMRSPPFVLEYGEDMAWLTSAPLEAQELFAKQNDDRPDDSPCSWYDAAKKWCRWHEHKPGICRDYAVGGESCRRVRANEVIIVHTNRS